MAGCGTLEKVNYKEQNSKIRIHDICLRIFNFSVFCASFYFRILHLDIIRARRDTAHVDSGLKNEEFFNCLVAVPHHRLSYKKTFSNRCSFLYNFWLYFFEFYVFLTVSYNLHLSRIKHSLLFLMCCNLGWQIDNLPAGSREV